MNKIYFLEDNSGFLLSEVAGLSEIYETKENKYKYDIYCKSPSLGEFCYYHKRKENVEKSRDKLMKAVDDYLKSRVIDQSL